MVSFSFSYGNNSQEVRSFGDRMNGILFNPSSFGDVEAAFYNVELTAELQSSFAEGLANTSIFLDTSEENISRYSDLSPLAFGTEMYASFADPSLQGGNLRQITLANGLNKYHINPYLYGGGMDVSNIGGQLTFKLNPNYTTKLGNLNFSYKANNSGNNASLTGNVDYSKKNDVQNDFNKKVRLIQQYGKDNSTSYDDKINEIRTEIGSDYAKGIQKLDELIATLDNTKLKAAAKKLHEEDKKAEKESAKTVSDSVVQSLISNTDGQMTVSSITSINSANVLSVLNQFFENASVKNGTVSWNDFMSNENSYNKIKEVLTEKANELKTTATEANKTKIENAVNALGTTKDASKIKALYTVLKECETAYLTDANVEKIYGVPSAS